VRFVLRLFGFLCGTAGAIGLLLCVAGIIGCWLLRAEAARLVNGTFGRAESMITDVRDSLDQVARRLRQSKSDLDTIRLREEHLAAQPAEERNAQRTLSLKAMAAIKPDLGEAREKLVKSVEAGLVLNGLLEALAEMPLVERTNIDTDRLKESSERLSELIQKADKFTASLAGAPGVQPEAQPADESARLAAFVDGIITRTEEGSSRAHAAGESLADRRTRVVYWIDLIAFGLTGALIWIGAGQLSLLARGRSLYRKYPRPAN
jgi:hypothetical protein